MDTGTTLTFDMNLALNPVSELQRAIRSQCKIPEEKQVSYGLYYSLFSHFEALPSCSVTCGLGRSVGLPLNLHLFSFSSLLFTLGKSSLNLQKCLSKELDERSER